MIKTEAIWHSGKPTKVVVGHGAKAPPMPAKGSRHRFRSALKSTQRKRMKLGSWV